MNTSENTELLVAGGDVDSIPETTDESQGGQGMVEYALIISLVVIVLILTVQVIGHQTSGMYSNISNGFVGH